ncbi:MULTISPECIES: glycoside hydrolase family 30 beta sandwich domain-containing protein [Curtobacterium]|uniref:glycoside hydrolase family 30 beta sandwich domain-containing protein n=1 Tax=Curtobacterium flaccumfaciens TaxID=2035 RepID=UPI003EE58D45
MMRRTRLAIVVAALASTAVIGVPTTSAQASGQTVSVTWSSEDGTYQLASRPSQALSSTAPTSVDATINVDPGATYQSIYGQGAVLESSSVSNIAHLSSTARTRMMNQLFDPASGNGYDLVRLPMGCPDMCSEPFYTYDDMPSGQTDVGLTHFSIQRDIDAGIISVAKQALAINPKVRFFMSMWSAPAWMKDNGSLINGGHVLPQYYPVLAQYQRKAIQAYEAQGIPISALTPQNEPSVVQTYPSGSWTGAEERDYIKVLGPELRNNGLSTQIWIGDDNPPSLKSFDPVILADPAAAQYVSAVAVHDYSGDDPAVLQDFHAQYPDLPIYLTERSYYGVNGETTTAGQYQAGIRRLIDFYRNGIGAWAYWITFLNTDGGPNTGPLDAACCSVPFSAPASDLDAYTTHRDYYLYGQITRFVAQGAVVIGSDETSTDVSNVAFRNPDGTVVVVVANGASTARSIAIRSSDGVVTDTLPALSVGTYRWTGGAVPDDPRVGTFTIVNRAQPDQALQATADQYGNVAGADNLVAAPRSWALPSQRWATTSAGDGYYRITNRSQRTQVAQSTGEEYGGYTGAYFGAVGQGSWLNDDQLWRIEPLGDGYYRFVDKARGTALQSTYDGYGSSGDVFQVATTPDAWKDTQQEWQLVPSS